MLFHFLPLFDAYQSQCCSSIRQCPHNHFSANSKTFLPLFVHRSASVVTISLFTTLTLGVAGRLNSKLKFRFRY